MPMSVSESAEYTTIQKSGVSSFFSFFYFKEINNFIQQGCHNITFFLMYFWSNKKALISKRLH